MKKIIVCIYLIALLVGCVSSAPYLTDSQEKRLESIEVYQMGSPPGRNYVVVGELDAADCTGPARSRLHGQEALSVDSLKRKAIALGADAIIDVACRHAPFVNNCWAASVCTGKAVVWK